MQIATVVALQHKKRYNHMNTMPIDQVSRELILPAKPWLVEEYNTIKDVQLGEKIWINVISGN